MERKHEKKKKMETPGSCERISVCMDEAAGVGLPLSREQMAQWWDKLRRKLPHLLAALAPASKLWSEAVLWRSLWPEQTPRVVGR